MGINKIERGFSLLVQAAKLSDKRIMHCNVTHPSTHIAHCSLTSVMRQALITLHTTIH